MKLVTAAEMKKLDRTAIEEFGIPGIVLMENAGKRVAFKCLEILGSASKDKRVLIFAGKGNNGGDGLVAARYLLNKGLDVKTFIFCAPSEFKGDAKINLDILQKMRGKIFTVLDNKDLNRVDVALMYADLVIDAVYGTGFKGTAGGITGEVLKKLEKFKRSVISVDLPSGLEADTGRVNGPCVNADYTLTFGLPKLGLLLEPGASFCGEIEVVDISIPAQLLSSSELKRNLITAKFCSDIIRPRKVTSHKGDFGHVLVAGGSPGMTGAVAMACEGALHTGAGLVTAAIPKSLNTVLELKLTEAMTKPLPETDEHTLGEGAAVAVLEMIDRISVLAVGPGMSTRAGGKQFLKAVLPQVKIPVVIDADGLNVLSKILEENNEFLRSLDCPIVITPHPGEMARLTGLSVAKIQSDRPGTAVNFASSHGVVVVLKGAKTVVATPEGELYLNLTGNPGMATGGSGDVLTGVIAALIAQGVKVNKAAAAGVFLHGFAGDLAAKEMGTYGVAAGNIIEHLPLALKTVVEEKEIICGNVVYKGLIGNY